jgi:hypothetical protein
VVVKLINTDELVVIGAGSEWFWTMLTMVALTVTFLAIYRQLRAQRAAVAFDQLQALVEEWLSDRMRYHCHRLVVGLRRGESAEQLENFLGITNFFEKLWLLHHKGYLDTEVLYVTFGEDVVRWWTVTAGIVEQLRIAYEHPGELAGFERLAVHMREMMAKRGVPPFKTDAASIAGRLDWMIEGYVQRRQIENEFKSWAIPPAPEPVAAN